MAEILRMPEVAANTQEAVLANWNIGLDTPYAAGDAIVTVETDKAVVDVEAESDGVLLRKLVNEGSRIEVGTPIAVWGNPGETAADVEQLMASLDPTEDSSVENHPAGADEPEAENSAAAAAVPGQALPPATGPALDTAPSNGRSAPGATLTGASRLFATPLVRKLARDSGLDLSQVSGSGPGGRIRRRDVDAVLAESEARKAVAGSKPVTPPASYPAAAAALAGPQQAAYEDIPNNRMRQAIARRLAQSKQTAPHFYLRGSAAVDKLLDMRRDLNDGGSVKVSVNHLIVKAVARAHVLVPGLNVQWNGDSIRHFNDVDIAVAIATEQGLVAPVVRGVDWLPLQQLVETTQDLVARAKERRLQQAELEGGSISVTNLGMYGTEEFAAIINPPQASILAVGAAREEPVVRNGQLAVGTLMRVTLAVDHRAVDGVTAAEWMRALVGLLEHPAQILL